MSIRQDIGCGIIVLNDEGKILLGQRVKSKEGEPTMMFSLPGGGLEKNETAIGACIRELKEETGLTYIDGLPLCECSLQINDYYYKNDSTFICTKYSGELRDTPDEMINWEFYSLEDILGMLLRGKLYPAAAVSIANYINWLGVKEYGKRLSM